MTTLVLAELLDVSEALYVEQVPARSRSGLIDLLAVPTGWEPPAPPPPPAEPHITWGEDQPPPWWDSDDVVAQRQAMRGV